MAEPEEAAHVADALVALMPRDAIFSLRFLGESRLRVLAHFQEFILAQFAKLGATPQSHPMLHAFAETHALTLRDFVLSGVEGAHQISLERFECLLGEGGELLRVDVWDQLKSHIGDAEAQFQLQAGALAAELERYRAPRGGGA